MVDPTEELSKNAQFSLGFGSALVLRAIVAGTYRAIRRITAERLIAAIALMGLVFVGASWSALVFASISAGVTVLALVLERSHPWPEPRTMTGFSAPNTS